MTISMIEVIQRLEEFCKLHMDGISRINVGNDSLTKVYQKTQYACLLDVMGKAAFPHFSKMNRNRFLSVIESLCAFPDSNRISIPHLHHQANTKNVPKLNSLKTYARGEVSKWSDGDLITLDRDPQLQDLLQQFPNLVRVEREHLEKLQHKSLIYSYRNGLVHEARMVGHAVQFSSDEIPYYISLSDLDLSNGTAKMGSSRWILVYPILFFKKLCIDALDNLPAFLRQRNINPLDAFSLNDYFL
jgi:hypothetical protein